MVDEVKEVTEKVADLDVKGDAQEDDGTEVDPWDVKGKVDYGKLIKKFGCQAITDEQVTRIERCTGMKAHHFLKRKTFFANRDLDQILEAKEKGQPFYLYTGRGPSSESLHLGHLVPFMFTKYLQDAFKVPLVIQLTDDEKVLWRSLGIEEAKRLARENAKDIIACGFDIDRTFLFQDFEYVGGKFYENINSIQRSVTLNQVRAAPFPPYQNSRLTTEPSPRSSFFSGHTSQRRGASLGSRARTTSARSHSRRCRLLPLCRIPSLTSSAITRRSGASSLAPLTRTPTFA